MKMINETRKILHNDDLKITATTVRVPVFYGHSESVNVELENSFELEDIFEMYRNAEGIILEDDVNNLVYPLPINAEGHDEVYVGRIRRDFSVDNGLNLWIVADNIRKGAASNAIQIAERMISWDK
jgi:aspartate-semialdehyde dehydrogenase